jgi:hypothetical protein
MSAGEMQGLWRREEEEEEGGQEEEEEEEEEEEGQGEEAKEAELSKWTCGRRERERVRVSEREVEKRGRAVGQE